MVIVLCLPFYSTAVPWEDDFDWNAFNYTPLVVGVVLSGHLAGLGPGHEQALHGPDPQIEFDEGMGIMEEKPASDQLPPPTPPRRPPGSHLELGGGRHEAAPALVLGRAPGVVARRLDPPVDRQQLGGLLERADHAGADGRRARRLRPPWRRRRPPRRARRSRRPGARAAAARWSRRRRPAGVATVDGLPDRGDDVRHPPRDALERGAGDVRGGGAAVEPGEHGPRLGPPPRARRCRPARAAPGRPPSRRPRARARPAPAGRRPRPAPGTATRASRPPRTRRRRARTPVRPSMRPGHGGQQAAGGLRHLVAHVGEHEDARCRRWPSPAPAPRSPTPASAACWSTTCAAQRQLDRPARGGAACPSSPALSRTSGSTSGGTPNRSHSHGSKPGVPRRVQLGARGRRGVGGEAGAEPVAQERVDGAHAQRAGLARARHGLVVLQQPRQLGRGEVGVEGQPAALAGPPPRGPTRRSSTSCERLSCQTTIGRERRPALGVPGQHRLALVVEPAGHHLARAHPSSSSATAVDHGGQHLLAVLLDPARPRDGG